MHNLFRNRVFRAAELAQQLTALAALAENIGLDPAPKWWLTTLVTSVPGDLTPSSYL